MANLWIGNSFGPTRIIAECEDFVEVNQTIDKFITDANARRTDGRPFKRYYTRVWNEGKFSVYDVGSHTEFFYYERNYPENEHGFVNESEMFE